MFTYQMWNPNESETAQDLDEPICAVDYNIDSSHPL